MEENTVVWNDDYTTGLPKYSYYWKKDGENIARGSCSGCLVTFLEVKREFVRQGYGSKMLHRLEERVKENGCAKVNVLAYPVNYPPTIISKKELKDFYKKNGYTQTWWEYISGSSWMSKDL